MKILTPVLFCFFSMVLLSNKAAAIEVITQAKPYRTSVLDYKPFAATKAYSISFNRIYMDARPLVGVDPILPKADSEFDSELYQCLNVQVANLSSYLEKSTKDSFKPKNIYIGVKQYDGMLLETLCRPSFTSVNENVLIMQTCYAPKSKAKDTLCLTLNANEIAEGFQHYAGEGDKRQKAMNDLQKSASRLLDLLSKKQ